MNSEILPSSVRYVKNGPRSRWWLAAKTNGQLHGGWDDVPDDLLIKKDFPGIQERIKELHGNRSGATQDFNQLHELLNAPSQHIWVTFEDGYLWWCTVHDEVTTTAEGSVTTRGHFWLTCNRVWSNKSINGRILAISDLPGTVTTTAGFRATVCVPRDWQSILRLIKDETDSDALKSADCRRGYEVAVLTIVKRLSPKDFEHLIDLILVRSGWERIATLGGTREGIDVEVENPSTAEIAFVQVKSSANQQVLNDYIERFRQRQDRYARMIFAVHSPHGKLAAPADPTILLWTGETVSKLVVRVGLGKWIESRLS